METIKTLNPLLDLDPTVYAAGFAADSEIRADLKAKGLSDEEVKEQMLALDYTAIALNNAKTSVDFILNDCFPERTWFKAYLTGRENFRKYVATIKPYKGNRDPNHKPKYFQEIREYLVSKYNAEVIDGQEADDAIGIKQFAHPDKSTCVVSIDKDLRMIPGYHFNPKKHTFEYITIDEANTFFFWQMMVGDTTDNIPGINKVGPKTADKIVEQAGGNLDTLRELVRELYQKQYGDDWQRAWDEVSRLLWIRRKEGQDPDV